MSLLTGREQGRKETMLMKNAKWWIGMLATGLLVGSVGTSWAGTETVDGVEWSFTLKNEAATVMGAEPAEEALVIPSVLGGYPVTGIAINAFFGRTGLTSVDIPPSLVSVGSRAFYGCTNLTAVYIHDLAAYCGISFVNEWANPVRYSHHLYLESEEVTNLVIPDGVPRVGNYAFFNCDNITNVVIPDSVESIGQSAFYSCSGLESVTFGNSLTTIGPSAFDWCGGLSSVTIPASVVEVGTAAFKSCLVLEKIDVASGNSVYESHNGVLFTKGKTALAQFPAGKVGRYTIPEGVEDIWDYAFEDCRQLSEITIPDSVASIGNWAFEGCNALTAVVLPSGLKNIPNGMFYWCLGLEKVTIPVSVTNIGRQAFLSCRNLETLEIPDSVTGVASNAFKNSGLKTLSVPGSWEGTAMLDDTGVPAGCMVLYRTQPDTEVVDGVVWSYALSNGTATVLGAEPSEVALVIPSVLGGCPVTGIGSNAFAGCNGLTSIDLPPSLVKVESYAFDGCTNLTTVYIHDLAAYCGISYAAAQATPNHYAQHLFLDGEEVTHLVIPDGVARVGNYAFFDCDNITNVVISDSVASIGGSAFAHCRDLRSVTFGKYVSSIGYYAFGYCRLLTTLTFPDSLTTIGASAFDGCEGLSTVTIPASVKQIGVAAFTSCSSLEKIDVAPDNSAYESEDGVLFTKGKTALVQFPAGKGGAYTVPDGVEDIWNYAFHGCGKVSAVVMPDSVKSIGKRMFQDCVALTTVSLPAGLTSIPEGAFLLCSALVEVSIPGSVTNIDRYAFISCRGLEALELPDSVADIGPEAFKNSGLKTLSVPGSWEGTAMLDAAMVPAGCTIVYRKPQETVEGVVWTYALTNGTATVLGAEPAAGALAIPSVLGGCPVTGIGSNAFDGCSELTSVDIPASIVRVGNHAFNQCTNLTAVYIHDLVAYCRISFSAAQATPNTYALHLYLDGEEVTNLVVPDGVTRVANFAFFNCDNITNIVIPDSVISMGMAAFANCRRLESVTIGNTVSRIGEYAFEGCECLSAITIPASVQKIGIAAFASCHELERITVEPDNPAYGTEDGVLFTKDKTTLVQFPAGKGGEYTVPDDVEDILNYAFDGCGKLLEVTIPSSVTNIGHYAFAACSGLETLELPDSVAGVGAGAFSNSGLKTLSVPGSWQGTTILDRASIPAGCVIVFRNPKETVDGVEWTYTLKNRMAMVLSAEPAEGALVIPTMLGECPVTVIESNAFAGCVNLASIAIPGGVTNIEKRAFFECGGLESVTIPPSVGQIGKEAFLNCNILEIVYISDLAAWCKISLGDEASNPLNNGAALFLDGEQVVDLSVPETATVIADFAFQGCRGLRSVYIPAGVENISCWAFGKCMDLVEFTVAEENTFYQSASNGFCRGMLLGKDGTTLVLCPPGATGQVEFPPGITRIGEGAFFYCIGITGADLPEGLVSIGDSAFEECTNMATLTIPNGVTNIGRWAFYDCHGLTSLAIPGTVKRIGKSAFCICQELREVEIGEGVEEIGTYAFAFCNAMTSLKIPASVKVIGQYAFMDCSDSLFDDASSPGVRLVDGWAVAATNSLAETLELIGIRGIAEYTFRGCRDVVSLAIGNGVEWIGTGAFASCSGLKTAEIAGTVKSIGTGAFSGCVALERLVVPKSWEGTDMLANAGVREECEIVYKGTAEAQTLEWSSLGTGWVPGDRVEMHATASGGGKVLFEVLSGPGVVEGEVLTFADTGTVEVRAFQAGSASWSAVEETRKVEVLPTRDGQRVHADLAANYEEGWDNGSNGGSGFSAWEITVGTGSGSGWAGCGTWNPSANGFAGTWAGKSKAFGMIGKGDGWSVTAARSFVRPLENGDSFSLEMAVNWDSNLEGATKGFALTADGEDIVVVNHGAYPGKISVNGDDGYDVANVPGLHPMVWTFTAVDATTIRFTATGRDNPGNVCTGMLDVAASAIDGFRLQSANQYALDANMADGDCRQNYYDNFRLFLSEKEPVLPPVEVPQSWLEENASDILAENGGNCEAAAKAAAANGLPVWKCYVAGLSTTNVEATFKVKSFYFENGEPVVEWAPDLNEDRTYTVQGKSAMTSEWTPADADSRFFRVLVEMPK